MSNHVSRRAFLATTSAAVPMAMLGRTTFQAHTAAPAGTFLRRDIGTLVEGSSIVQSYRTAIAAMKLLPVTNPCSWCYQAAIHGVNLGTGPCTNPTNLTAWNTCQHGNNFFWSWHRMYLYWWERIIRKMSGDSAWALPYWNWSNLSERQLPYMFRDQTGAPELYDANRGPGWNTAGAGSAALPASDVDTSVGFAYSDFNTAQYQLQSLPHDQVHVDIGGDMGSVPTAALDPIFYLHHANMDRLWDEWLAQGGRSDPVSDSSWTNQGPWTFFDENCSPVTMTACEILRAAQQLNYTYEYECPQVNDYCDTFCYDCYTLGYCCISILDIQPFNLGSGPVVVSIGVLSDQYWQAVQNSDFLTLQINKVQALHQPGASWEVYVGLPVGVQPYPESQYYVGSVVLFGSGIHDEGHGHGLANFNLVINHAVLGTQKGAPLTLTFVPHGPLIDGKPSQPKVRAEVNVGSLSIAIGKEVPPNVGP